MSDPVRLLATAGRSNVRRQMFEAWQQERPSDQARAATLAALGLEAASRQGKPSTSTGWWKAALPKATLSLALLTAMLVAIAWLEQRHAKDVTAPSAPVTPQVAVVQDAPQQLREHVVAEPSSKSVTSATTRSIPRPRTSSLTAEMAMVDAARAALERGDASLARALADRYDLTYSAGQFVQEAAVIRIEAVLMEGGRDEANQRACAFERAHPESPHEARLHLLGLGGALCPDR